AIPGVTIHPDTLTAAIEPAYIVVTRSFLRQNYTAVVNTLAALKEANTWMLSHMTAAAGIVGSFVGAPVSALEPSMKVENYTVSWTPSDLASFEAIARVLMNQHLVTVAPRPSQDINTGPITKVGKG
ncbi:MAG: hypothetical protein ACYDCB_10375, partial [Candidatus Dormibacteria bacterium]